MNWRGNFPLDEHFKRDLLMRFKFELAASGLAATGVAHFIAPALFEPITKPAFPKDTEKWIVRGGEN